MSWEHCELTIPDDDVCPTCGVTKEQWTVAFNVTRTFTVTRRAAQVRLALVDAAGQPVAGEPYRALLPGGRAVEGELDDLGAARLSTPGPCRVTFTRRARGEVARASALPDADAERDAGDASSDGEEPAPAAEEGPEDDEAGWPEDSWVARLLAGDRLGDDDHPQPPERRRPEGGDTDPGADREQADDGQTTEGPDADGAFLCEPRAQRHVFRLGFAYLLLGAKRHPLDDDDRYLLEGADGVYRCERAVRDAERTPEGHLVLWFDPPPAGRFTLTWQREGAQPLTVFREQPLRQEG